jgi:DNA invertase Pin-like site-specific DNA recombinase
MAGVAKSEGPGLSEALEFIRPGDTLIAWRLDRLGRSLRDLIDTIRDFESRRVGFRCLNEAVNTTSSGGKLILQLFGALAKFERGLIRARTRGKIGSSAGTWPQGRPTILAGAR